MQLQVVFTPEAEQQLLELYRYIGSNASALIATRYTDALVSYCQSFAGFPYRGTRRDDLRAGLRIAHFRGRTVIAFAVRQDRVEILGCFHGGRDYDRWLVD